MCKASQQNVEACLRHAISYGMNHIETARAYGSSETQIGRAIQNILKDTPRDSLIIQTKGAPKENPEDFRAQLETSFSKLFLDGLGYVDLFAIHGVNHPKKLAWALKCLPVLKEYQAAGKIRHLGFSTHGATPVIIDAINQLDVDYVNLHYHFIGSYTTLDNLAAIEAARSRDMGVFIISPTDKGGMLYKPSPKFAEACKPLSPIGFNNLWLLSNPDIHTLVVGAEKPSDFDEHMRNIQLYDRRAEVVPPIAAGLIAMARSVLGEAWVPSTCTRMHEVVKARGLPTMFENEYGIACDQIVWLMCLHKAFDMTDYGKKIYQQVS